MYYIYKLVEGADYPALRARQRALALVKANSKLRRKSLDVPDIICTYGCDASEEDDMTLRPPSLPRRCTKPHGSAIP